MTDPTQIKALTFDVFGTVVDWRTSIIREGEALGARRGLTDIDWVAFADDWRGLYQPSMARVRDGQRPWTKLDDLHRESLVHLLTKVGIDSLSEAEINEFNCAWHRLDPWPDTVPGMTRLRTKFTLASLSNGNVALLVNMAKRSGLPWDAVLGAEVARAYKPLPEAYLRTADLLGIAPEQCMLVAAHNDDLLAAAAQGFKTAFVARPTEHGPNQSKDIRALHEFDFVVNSMIELADTLGCR